MSETLFKEALGGDVVIENVAPKGALSIGVADFGTILLGDVRRILEIALTAWLPTLLRGDEEDGRMTELPAVLQSALDLRSQNVRARPPVDLSSSRIERGDLRFVRWFDGRSTEVRLVLVLSVDSHRDYAEVMLVHTSPELACDVDVVVLPNDSLAPYEVVVETDLRGVVWSWQIAKAVGHLDSSVLDEIGIAMASLLSDEVPQSLLSTTPRLAGSADSRWAFKKGEGESLRRLTMDATEALLDDGAPWVVLEA